MKDTTTTSSTIESDTLLFGEVLRHNQLGFQETDNRTTGKNRIGSISFNEADELFRSWLDEKTWPYDALLFDPRVFTFIFEKTSRLISSKPKASLTPRESSDVLAAKLNNILLDYQWDVATHGGSMISKWALMDMTARKYGASFALCKWRYEVGAKDKCLFDGPEMQVINNRDFAHDISATSIENCNWVQVRQFVTFQDLKHVNDASSDKPIYKNMDKLRAAIGADSNSGGGDHGSSNWQSRNRQISNLEQDPIGKDDVFKTVEIVTEYRRDRWITFAPKHGVILRDIPNPYENNEIPVTMLKYYAIDDDLYGLSEIEPVKGLQKAINALLCQYVDEINQNLYSPIAMGPGVRQHTVEWGKGARWICNNPMTDFRIVEGKSNAAAYFQNTYSVLVAAMMNALGESSLGISNIQPFQQEKTATEVKALQIQRNARDNFNQIFLSESIKRQHMLWHSMNKKMLFADPKKTSYIVRIAGKDAMDLFQRQGLDKKEIPEEAFQAAYELQSEDGSDFAIPKYPVKTEDGTVVPKMQIDDGGKSARIYLESEDLNGMFDFSIDVQSMQANADDARREGRQTAVNLLVSNPNVGALLQQEGYKPKFRELFTQWLEDLGFTDAERYFEKNEAAAGGDPMSALASAMGGGGGAAGGGGQMSPATAAERAQATPNPQATPQTEILPPQIRGSDPTDQSLGNPNQRLFKQMISGA